MESAPTPEKRGESPRGPGFYAAEKLLGMFDAFRQRPDTPRYSYEEQERIGERFLALNEELLRKKSPELEQELETISAQIKESKADKKHVAALSVPITAAMLFLEESEDAKKIPETERTKLAAKARELWNAIGEAWKEKNISDELIAESLQFMNDVEKYLK